jgi:hypothetical protein
MFKLPEVMKTLERQNESLRQLTRMTETSAIMALTLNGSSRTSGLESLSRMQEGIAHELDSLFGAGSPAIESLRDAICGHQKEVERTTLQLSAVLASQAEQLRLPALSVDLSVFQASTNESLHNMALSMTERFNSLSPEIMSLMPPSVESFVDLRHSTSLLKVPKYTIPAFRRLAEEARVETEKEPIEETQPRERIGFLDWQGRPKR